MTLLGYDLASEPVFTESVPYLETLEAFGEDEAENVLTYSAELKYVRVHRAAYIRDNPPREITGTNKNDEWNIDYELCRVRQ